MGKWWTKLFRRPCTLNDIPKQQTIIKLEEIRIQDGDKLAVIYEQYLTKDQQNQLKTAMEDFLADKDKRVVVLEGNPRLVVIR